MGKYLNPVSAVVESQERLVGSGLSEEKLQWEHYRALARGKHLVAVCDRGIFKQAPVVDDFREYQEFHEQYKRGILLTFDVYAVTEEFLRTHV